MTTDPKPLLTEQWQTLHNNHESYEKYALIIKLFAIGATLFSFVQPLAMFVMLLILACLWLQEGIWKTYQSRAAEAILAIEASLAKGKVENEPMQSAPYLLYSHWQANRPSVKGLVSEYISNSLKPTVLYPYFPLMLLVLIF